MTDFQMDFGVLDWNSDEQKSEAETERDSTISSHSLPVSHYHALVRHTTLGSLDVAGTRHEDQIRRIQKVRDRCTSQNKALSVWWKIALQSNVQQRMWMKLGNPMESTIPPRFERLYQPEKLAQFDRFFARPWATPVRRSHSAQHNPESDDDAETAVFRRNITGVSRKIETRPDTKENQREESNATLDLFAQNYGFATPKQAMTTSAPMKEDGTPRTTGLHTYIGDMDVVAERVRKEYEDYVQPQDDSNPFRKNAFEEFKQALHPLSLGADDVDGIRKVGLPKTW